MTLPTAATPLDDDLKYVEREPLLAFARHLKLPVPDDIGRQQLIARLQENHPEQLAAYLRLVRRVDLLHKEQELLERLAKAQEELPREVQRGFKRLIGSLEFLKTATGAIVAAVGILAGSGAGFATFKGCDNQRQTAAALATMQTMGRLQKRTLAHSMIEGFEGAMREASITTPVQERAAKLADRDLRALKDLPLGGDEVDTALELLRALNEGLIDLRKANLHDVAALNEQSRRWGAIVGALDKAPLKDADLDDFRKRARGYVENVLGILDLIRHSGNAKDLALLDRAQKHFDAADEALQEFSRVKSNLAVVASRRCAAKPQAEQEKCLSAVPPMYEHAMSFAETPAEVATIYNNIAMAHLRVARAQYQMGRYDEMEKTLEKARAVAKLAEQQPVRSEMGYETHAQLEALHLAAQVKRQPAAPLPALLERIEAPLYKAAERQQGNAADCTAYLRDDIFGDRDALEYRELSEEAKRTLISNVCDDGE